MFLFCYSFRSSPVSTLNITRQSCRHANIQLCSSSHLNSFNLVITVACIDHSLHPCPNRPKTKITKIKNSKVVVCLDYPPPLHPPPPPPHTAPDQPKTKITVSEEESKMELNLFNHTFQVLKIKYTTSILLFYSN